MLSLIPDISFAVVPTGLSENLKVISPDSFVHSVPGVYSTSKIAGFVTSFLILILFASALFPAKSCPVTVTKYEPSGKLSALITYDSPSCKTSNSLVSPLISYVAFGVPSFIPDISFAPFTSAYVNVISPILLVHSSPGAYDKSEMTGAFKSFLISID